MPLDTYIMPYQKKTMKKRKLQENIKVKKEIKPFKRK